MSDDLELLVRSLRERADCARSEGNMTATCDADYFARSADTIERLTAEVATERAASKRACELVIALEADVNDLKHDIARHMQIANDAEAEAARLREALEIIVSLATDSNGDCVAVTVRALRGEEG